MVVAHDQLWRVNQEFLDKQITEGKTFYFTKDPATFTFDSYSYMERQYLLSNSYTIEEVGNGIWKAVTR